MRPWREALLIILNIKKVLDYDKKSYIFHIGNIKHSCSYYFNPRLFFNKSCMQKPSAGFLTKAGDYKEAAKCLNNKQGKIIMFHGVSVGEVIALENLIKLARENF